MRWMLALSRWRSLKNLAPGLQPFASIVLFVSYADTRPKLTSLPRPGQ
jgi:hypothetical protein